MSPSQSKLNALAFPQDYTVVARALGATCNHRLAAALSRQLRLLPGMSVADLGCGCGGDAGLLAKYANVVVVGVDRSAAMLREVPASVVAIRADVAQLPFGKSTFDATYTVNLLQIIPDRVCFFNEIRRILKIGGRFAIPITTHEQIGRRFLNRFFPNLAAVDKARYPTIAALSRELRASGFSRPRSTPLDLGSIRIDRDYVRRQRTMITSGILLLDESERRIGLTALEDWVYEQESSCLVHRFSWQRTMLVTKKSGRQRE